MPLTNPQVNVIGLDSKPSVVAATTANISLSGAQTVDGVSVVATNRVLVKSQTADEENGIYVASAGAWARAGDLDTWSEVPNAFVFVEGGTTLSTTGWVCSSPDGGTIDVTAITFVQFSGSGSTVVTGTAGQITVVGGGGATPTVSLPSTITQATAFSGVTTISNATPSTNTTTGALTVAGGVGVAGSMNAGGTITGSNLSGTNTGDNTVATSGAATTAETLLTARNINGVAFDGSAAITVNAVDSTSRLASSAVSGYGLTLIDDADAATARTTLGLGTLATQSGTFSGTSSARTPATTRLRPLARPPRRPPC